MKKNEPVITFDHMEDEKQNSNPTPFINSINYFDLAMFVAEELLAIIILASMLFLL